MKTEKVLLSQVVVNKDNPRSIKERKLETLVDRLLAFPKMIGIRPVVVDGKMVALGGNMRLRAFQRIAEFEFPVLAKRLAATKNFQRLSKPEQERLLSDWQGWLEKPTVEIAKADGLSEAEKREFIIADNASFGEWDYDKLANEWDAGDLVSWGVDVWQPEENVYGGLGTPTAPAVEIDGEDSDDIEISDEALPDELKGLDISKDNLPKIEGDDNTLMERVIIVYPKGKTSDVAALLGLPSIAKVVYNIDELQGA